MKLSAHRLATQHPTRYVDLPVVSGEKVLGELPDGVEGGEVQLDEVNVVVAAQLPQLPQRWPSSLPAPEIEKKLELEVFQCCGSGAFFTPWIRDPRSGMVKKSRSGSGMNNPDHISAPNF